MNTILAEAAAQADPHAAPEAAGSAGAWALLVVVGLSLWRLRALIRAGDLTWPPSSPKHRISTLAFSAAVLWTMLSALAAWGLEAPEGQPPVVLTTEDLVGSAVTGLGVAAVLWLLLMLGRRIDMAEAPRGPGVGDTVPPATSLDEDPAPSGESVAAPSERLVFPRRTPSEWPTPGTPAGIPAAPPGRRPLIDQLCAGAGLGLAALAPALLIGAVLQTSDPDREMHPLLDLLQQQSASGILVLVILLAVVIAPLQEELLFRGILHGWLADRSSRWGGIAAAGLFALIHGPATAPALLPLALMLGWNYERRRSLAGVIAAHATFNAVNIGLLLVSLGG